MRLLVDKFLFGREQYLIMDGDGYSWINDRNIDHDLFLDINEANTLNEYLRLYGIDPMIFIDEKYQKMLSLVGAQAPNWKHILPTSIFSKK